jgi:hypothetical protein
MRIGRALLMTSFVTSFVVTSAVGALPPRKVAGFQERIINWVDFGRSIVHPDWNSLTEKSDPATIRSAYRREFARNAEFAAYVCLSTAQNYARPDSSKPTSEWGKQIVAILAEECVAHPPLAETAAQVKLGIQRLESPFMNAMHFAKKKPSRRQFLDVARIYVPPPYDPAAWAIAAPVIDYGAALRSEFERDPYEVAYACSEYYGDPIDALSPPLSEYRKVFTEVCDALPLDRVAIAVAKANGEVDDEEHANSMLWLSGLLNAKVEALAKVADSARRQRFEQILLEIKSNQGSKEDFEGLIEAFVLRPADPRAAMVLIRHANYVRFAKDLTNEDLIKFFVERLRNPKTIDPPRTSEWIRGARNILFITGHYSEAKSMSDAVLKGNGVKARDRIYAAEIDRVIGSRAAFDRFLQQCPEPDELYIATHGKPNASTTFCRDVMSEMASAGLELQQKKAPPALIEIFASTNRASTHTSPFHDSGLDDTADYIARVSEMIDAAITDARKLSPGERLRKGLDEQLGCVTCEGAIRAMALRPYDDRPIYSLLHGAAEISYTPDVDVRAAMAKVVQQVIDRERKGPEGAEWKRADRALAFYTGRLEKARQLSRELAAEKAPGHYERDRIFSAVIDYLFGKEEPFRKLATSCPASSARFREMYPTNDVEYCTPIGLSMAGRMMNVLKKEAPPAVVSLATSFLLPDDYETTYFVASALAETDVARGEQALEALLKDPRTTTGQRDWIITRLIGLAFSRSDYARSLELELQEVSLSGMRDPGFDPASWQKLALQPEFKGCSGCGGKQDLLLGELQWHAMKALRFDIAERAIEARLTSSFQTADTGKIRYALLTLAEEEMRHDRPAARRILAYLKSQPLPDSEQAKFDALVKSSGLDLGTDVPTSPWESKMRDRGGAPPGVSMSDI